jgi:hypothetical protein
MTIKKSNLNPENWANQAGNQNPEPDKSGHKADKKIVFSARIPESLYNELKSYIEKYGKEKESINDIIIAGAREELETRLKKHSQDIGNEAKKEDIIKTIEKNLRELKTLL